MTSRSARGFLLLDLRLDATEGPHTFFLPDESELIAVSDGGDGARFFGSASPPRVAKPTGRFGRESTPPFRPGID